MARIDWAQVGSRYFEAGIDRGVLYVGNNPGVPWVGLIGVEHNASGGDAKPRYLDGVKISNYAAPEEFEATIEAFTYPTAFEQCDGTAHIQNGLRVSQQFRKSFGMTYRTKVGNDAKGLDLAYKIHILYNLRAEPTDRGYETLGDDNEAMSFSWGVTSRGEMVTGLFPSAHFTVDSRDVPAELLQDIENILYGDSSNEPKLPSPGELIFLFDSFEDLVYDAGDPFTPVFAIYDAGDPLTPVTETIDGGTL
jgi:hypothetical protein